MSAYISSFLGVCCLQSVGSVASSVLSQSESRLTPGVPLSCFGQLVVYAGLTELREWLLLVVPSTIWCLLLSLLCRSTWEKED